MKEEGRQIQYRFPMQGSGSRRTSPTAYSYIPFKIRSYRGQKSEPKTSAMADDDSSSSSSDSDHEKRVAAIGSNTGGLQINSDSDDDDDDDDSDLDGIQLYANQSKGRRGANRNFRSRKQEKALKSVLMDKDSDDEDDAEMKPVESSTKKPTPPKRTVYELDSSSDSDNDGDTGRKRPSISDLAREGKVDETTAQNAKLVYELLNPVISVDSPSKSDASANALAEEEDQLRHLTIQIQGYDTVKFAAPETSTAREVLSTTLEMLRLPPKTSIGCLRHGERTLLDHQILMELPPKCDLTATIMGEAKKQQKKVDIGPLLRLQVRVGADTKTVQLGQRQVLRDLGFAKLRFDGDILDLDKPATFYELEEDDLLDVPGS